MSYSGKDFRQPNYHIFLKKIIKYVSKTFIEIIFKEKHSIAETVEKSIKTGKSSNGRTAIQLSDEEAEMYLAERFEDLWNCLKPLKTKFFREEMT